MITVDLKQFINKQHWKWVLKDSTPGIRLHKRSSTPFCPVQVDPAWAAWVSRVTNLIAKSVDRARAAHKYDRSFSKFTRLQRFGLRLLKASDLRAIPTDKDGGFAVENADTVIKVHCEILGGKDYSEIPYCTWENTKDLCIKIYIKLAKSIETHFNQPGLFNALSRPLREPAAKLESRLMTTCKTHKEVVKHRAIHASPSFMLIGLASWVTIIIRKAMEHERYRYIIKDSKEFIKAIEQVKAQPKRLFYKS